MDTIVAVLEPDADGTVHVPVPIALRGAKVRVTAKMEPVRKAKRDRLETNDLTLEEIFEKLRASGIAKKIPDPVGWQRKQRKDRKLPGREESSDVA
jgi:hypothetical protein